MTHKQRRRDARHIIRVWHLAISACHFLRMSKSLRKRRQKCCQLFLRTVLSLRVENGYAKYVHRREMRPSTLSIVRHERRREGWLIRQLRFGRYKKWLSKLCRGV